MKLKKLQQEFKAAIKNDVVPENLNPLRFKVYSQAYWIRMEESLEEDFPLLVEALGEDSFSELVEDFLIHMPSKFSSLSEVSKALPNFLSNKEWSKRYPYAVDLARIEISELLSRQSRWIKPSDFTELSKFSQEELLKVVFYFQPSARLLRLDWSIDTNEFARSKKQKLFYLILKEKCGLKTHPLQEFEFKILEHLIQKDTLGSVLEKLETDAPLRLGESFRKWAEIGLFISYELKM